MGPLRWATVGLLALACSTAPAPRGSPPAAPAEAVSWTTRPLVRLDPLAVPRGTLLLDAGHGAAGNPGNTNWACEEEQSVMRRLADAVAEHLVAAGGLVVRTRPDAREVSYDDRMVLTGSATWLVSLHSDSRAGTSAALHPETGCAVVEGAQGFAVLWSDEGEAPLVEARHTLARAVARRMAEAGFLPYPGTDYAGLYEGEAVAGVFVDRHAPSKRIRFLRRPTIPSVLVETHQAGDPAEARRWEEPDTREAFARALQAALVDVEQAPIAP